MYFGVKYPKVPRAILVRMQDFMRGTKQHRAKSTIFVLMSSLRRMLEEFKSLWTRVPLVRGVRGAVRLGYETKK